MPSPPPPPSWWWKASNRPTAGCCSHSLGSGSGTLCACRVIGRCVSCVPCVRVAQRVELTHGGPGSSRARRCAHAPVGPLGVSGGQQRPRDLRRIRPRMQHVRFVHHFHNTRPGPAVLISPASILSNLISSHPITSTLLWRQERPVGSRRSLPCLAFTQPQGVSPHARHSFLHSCIPAFGGWR